jgi:hypothetical protein
MDLIEKNPYRIIGLLANSNEIEFQARKGFINRHLSIGRILQSEFNFPFLNPIELTEAVFDQAFSKFEILFFPFFKRTLFGGAYNNSLKQ